MNVLTSITVLGFLIFFHEMGHFLPPFYKVFMLMDFQLALGPQLFKKSLEILLIHLEPFLLEALYPSLMKSKTILTLKIQIF